ncbi:MAG: ErfK/YbiS/YcfS/YnhG family protein [Chthoniobacteraceae bacterium]|nr:ErfK/YbiS/YcfS/YnhG family protein [Chthoniobacteraceae bacterium]
MFSPRRLLLLTSLFFSAAPCFALPRIIVSIPEQTLLVLDDTGGKLGKFPVSTSRFGVGDRPRSFATPLGSLAVAGKVGAGAPSGTVFKGRRPTGEILAPNAPGRDPIVTRILHLRGLEASNARAFNRGIYIHGTPVESSIGRPASYGCIRMRSNDVMRVFDAVPVGTPVEIINSSLGRAVREAAATRRLGAT